MSREIPSQQGSQAEFNKLIYELPRLIDVPYPHVASGDLLEILRKIDPTISSKDADPFQQKMFSLQQAYMPVGATFYSYTVEPLAEKVKAEMAEYTERSEKKVGFAIIDRLIGFTSAADEIFRLHISRGNNNDIIPRSKEDPPVEVQMDNLAKWAIENSVQDIQVVDDILAFGQTLVPVVEKIKLRLPHIQLGIQVGLAASGGDWRGYEIMQEKFGITPEYVTRINASDANPRSLGMSIPTSKGMTIFGGYRDSDAPANRPVSFPHMLPFAIPRPAFFDIDKRFEASEKLLDFSQSLIAFVESRMNSPLLIVDLLSCGFGIPYTRMESLREALPFPEMTMSVREYLLQVQDAFDSQQELLCGEIEKANDLEREKFEKAKI
jgi:hypothetical protein